MGKILDRLIAGFAINYLRLVRVTGKITFEGCSDLVDSGEKFVIGFWHGDSFCYYPLLPYGGHVVVTTSNKRGAVVERIGRRFGYIPIRLPDRSDPNISLMGLRRMLSDADGHHICLSMDGPSGPRHVPARFFLTSAVLAKKRILPISVSVRRKIRSKKRWDKYMLPLPFAHITFTFHEPLEAKKSEFEALGEEIVQIMNKGRG
jgi:hypothetical protein